MAGVKGRSGRKREISSIVREAIDAVSQDLPDLFRKLSERAKDGDREAAIYLIDRVLGKPKQQTELTGADEIGVKAVVELFRLVQERERERQLPGCDILEIEDKKE